MWMEWDGTGGWQDGIGYHRSYVGLLRAPSVLKRAIFQEKSFWGVVTDIYVLILKTIFLQSSNYVKFQGIL